MRDYEIEHKLITHDYPGYILGLDRLKPAARSHIYKGTFSDPEEPLCPKGYREDGSYSIFRNNLGSGVCRTCLKNLISLINLKE